MADTPITHTVAPMKTAGTVLLVGAAVAMVLVMARLVVEVAEHTPLRLW